MKDKRLVLISLFLFLGIMQSKASDQPTNVLYDAVLNDKNSYPELELNGVASTFTADGLQITGKENVIRLNKYYSLGERTIRYHVKFSPDAVAVFLSSTGDFKVLVNIPEKTVSVETNPVSLKKIDFINPDGEYFVEIYHKYQTNIVRVVDAFTGETGDIELTNDGTGGTGAGIVNSGFYVGSQHDYYCFGLQKGTSLLVKQISVTAGLYDLNLLIYGDSITEPEGYYPTSDFASSWTQLVIKNIKGKVMCSGRGGCTINEVLERIKNELPYVKAKYVMVTIGTNGGNTEDNLSELVEYIISQGSIPILNNIPANESGTQVESNKLIQKVRGKYNINGCKFDLPTSLGNDGIEVDKTTMYFEDYSGSTGWQIYHHPNVKGAGLMYDRTLTDTPEIYE
ncbi:MAG: SGNH/GDSL hydrolase family protein [Prevotella sp.]|jgi:hypothetical protein|nr:SGNH/GDSL hydrolase family protein [Prevotella sp.]